MRVREIIWLPEIEDKLWEKHHHALVISSRDMDGRERKTYGIK